MEDNTTARKQAYVVLILVVICFIVLYYIASHHENTTIKWIGNPKNDPTFSMAVIDSWGRTNTLNIDVGMRSDGVLVWKLH